MNVDKAVEQISDIHRHLAKSEVFYGYKPMAVLLVGLLAFIIAIFQSLFIVPANNRLFLIQWLIAAGIVIVIMGGNILYNYLRNGSQFEIQQMSKVFLQFVPSLVGGLIITSVMFLLESTAIAFLPGIWAILFSLGIFSMRPYLPRMVGFLSLFYLFAGAILLYLVKWDQSFSPWGLGLTFGFGHLFTALVLYLDVERTVS